MPATPSQITLIRMQTADTATPPAFSDAEINLLWDVAAEIYSANSQILIQTKIYMFDGLLADAAKRVNYKQNQSSENLSDIFKHLLELRKLALADLESATNGVVSPVQLATTRRARPTRAKDVPSA